MLVACGCARLVLMDRPNDRTAVPAKRRGALSALLAVALLLILASAAAWWRLARDEWPLPAAIRSQAGFSLYYPTVIPAGYSYTNGSARIQRGVLFFTISSGNKVVRISEQKLPSNPPRLDDIPSLKKVIVPAGQAGLGTNDGKTTGVLVSTTSIVSLTGEMNLPDDVVARLLESMTSLPN